MITVIFHTGTHEILRAYKDHNKAKEFLKMCVEGMYYFEICNLIE